MHTTRVQQVGRGTHRGVQRYAAVQLDQFIGWQLKFFAML